MDTEISIDKLETHGYKYWREQQCQKNGGHTYATCSRWGIIWIECIHCGKRLKIMKEGLRENNKEI